MPLTHSYTNFGRLRPAGQIDADCNIGKFCAAFACWHHAAPAMTLGSCCRMRSPSAVRTPGCPLHTSLARCGYSRLQPGGKPSIHMHTTC